MRIFPLQSLTVFLALLLLAATGTATYAEDLAERIRNAAIAMSEAQLRQDSKALVNYTAEPLIRLAGGVEAMTAKVQAEFQNNRKENIRLISYSFIKPDRVHYLQGTLFALVERKSKWQAGPETMNLRYNVLAVSADGGSTWRFAEASSISEDQFRQLFGFFDAQLFSEFYQYTSERTACKKEP